ncbi:hypothetical protein [Bradyrhizobium amphicarpaeae]|uniref:hypothetical protein n=1 Tax=Bradyrhizobium amphicarpaeae TaxID=1404768 RepID=UPI0011E4D1D5|nr:hypothetical protein [Bradyrhizobium amphicarpaeae]
MLHDDAEVNQVRGLAQRRGDKRVRQKALCGDKIEDVGAEQRWDGKSIPPPDDGILLVFCPTEQRFLERLTSPFARVLSH